MYSDLSQQRMRSLYTRYYNGVELARGGLVPSGGGRGYNVARTPLQSPIDHWGKWDNFRDFRGFVEGKRREVDNQYSFSLSEFWYRYISFRPFPNTITFLPKVPSLPLDGTGFVNDPANTIKTY